jgi:nucleotide-binding universal stress UspA family protein
VVVPLDGSELAESALPTAGALARTFDVPILLLRALSPLRTLRFDALPESIETSRQLLEDGRKEAAAYLDAQVTRLSREGLLASAAVATETGPVQAIVDRAEGDVIVMCTRGRGGLERGLFGSVADKVVRCTTGPVLVIPPRGEHAPQRRRPRTPPVQSRL